MNLLPLWAQQIAGVNRQWASYSNYGSGTDDLTSDPLWIAMYGVGRPGRYSSTVKRRPRRPAT